MAGMYQSLEYFSCSNFFSDFWVAMCYASTVEVNGNYHDLQELFCELQVMQGGSSPILFFLVHSFFLGHTWVQTFSSTNFQT